MKQHNTDDVLADNITQQLDDDMSNLDTDIAQRLSANRQNVIANMPNTSSNSLFNFGWLNSTAFITASLLVVTASLFFMAIDKQAISVTDNNVLLSTNYNISDDAVIAEYELLNDLEFISWLIEEENVDENYAG